MTGKELLEAERGLGMPLLVQLLAEEAIKGFPTEHFEWYDESYVEEMIAMLPEAYCQDFDRVSVIKR